MFRKKRKFKYVRFIMEKTKIESAKTVYTQGWLATPTARTHGLHARSPLEYLTTLLARVKSLCGSEKMADSDLVMKSSNSLL